MTPDVVLSLARESSIVILIVAGPLLGVGLAVGIAVSIVQAVTQVQEATLTFIPKLVALFVVLALLGNWMLSHLVGYTVTLLTNLPAYAR
jgi:flagellar biosynthetic protein FliQ